MKGTRSDFHPGIRQKRKAQPEMQEVFLLDAGDRPLVFCHDYAEASATVVYGDVNGTVYRQGCAIAAGTRY